MLVCHAAFPAALRTRLSIELFMPEVHLPCQAASIRHAHRPARQELVPFFQIQCVNNR